MWTKRSYDAVHDWPDASKRTQIKEVLEADDLHDVVERLESATTLGEWYRITREASKAVGSAIVKQSANEAEKELSIAAPG